ncbi:MEDS domain-containing protein [Halalkalibacter akibai]|uniref:histidine kinase n=1 Tax=Halalkalibacter akibai (strain ATCC 43226 / DSM 21942 / CIP 109018 / JCM 9157 / 1139) TaxID=1236973 RepID=W4R0N0_HALA3|nr:MEDS domain-containing protein [Halalkalibacter akibai]GAE37448.1 two-component sensor histidine kinase [Halalkalibacter akibai JCM 9157]
MQTKSISLTENIQVNDGSHILYFYQSEEKYIENLISFILSAKQMNQHVIVIESYERYNHLLDRLGEKLQGLQLEEMLHYKNNIEFYQLHGDFKFERALESFKIAVQPFVNEELSVRVWGKVSWRDLTYSQDGLHKYEHECDLTVSEIGYMTVCVYDGNEVPAAVQTEMMRSHPYLMTDRDLVKSSLYNHKDHTVFPSLSAQRSIESELDFYRQKLDFIHVVAHEVRNPLTVIKSFATILKSEIFDKDIQAKLSLIEDYSVAIDHEIHHIIQTEQMLTMDSFWKTKLIKVVPAMEEVIDVLTVKARTQNIQLITDLTVPGSVIINGNLMGFKLIISNLLSNAIKYSYEGQMVYIKSFTKKGKIHIHIRDNGVGMSKEDLAKLFQKYQKINQEVAGQGIGLFMVYQLVTHFKGEIDVTSERDCGTEVRVTFPL